MQMRDERGESWSTSFTYHGAFHLLHVLHGSRFRTVEDVEQVRRVIGGRNRRTSGGRNLHARFDHRRTSGGGRGSMIVVHPRSSRGPIFVPQPSLEQMGVLVTEVGQHFASDNGVIHSLVRRETMQENGVGALGPGQQVVVHLVGDAVVLTNDCPMQESRPQTM